MRLDKKKTLKLYNLFKKKNYTKELAKLRRANRKLIQNKHKTHKQNEISVFSSKSFFFFKKSSYRYED